MFKYIKNPHKEMLHLCDYIKPGCKVWYSKKKNYSSESETTANLTQLQYLGLAGAGLRLVVWW